MAHRLWLGAKHSLKEATTTSEGLPVIWASSICFADAILGAESLKTTLEMCLVKKKKNTQKNPTNSLLLTWLLWRIELQEQKLLSVQTNCLTTVWEGRREQEGKVAQSTQKKIPSFCTAACSSCCGKCSGIATSLCTSQMMLQHQSICSWRPDLQIFCNQ